MVIILDKKIMTLLRRIKSYLHEKYGDLIKEVILYGSYARGEADEDSDVDVLVIVSDFISPWEVRRGLSDILYDIFLEENKLISVVVLPESHFKGYNYPFILNVRREGMVV